MRHPRGICLMQFFDGELQGRREHKVARHVERCDRCCDVVAGYGRVRQALHGFVSIPYRPPDTPLAVRHAPLRRVRAAALAAVLVIALGLLVLTPRSPQSPGISLIRPAADGSTVAAASRPATRPLPAKSPDTRSRPQPAPGREVSVATDEPRPEAPSQPESGPAPTRPADEIVLPLDVPVDAVRRRDPPVVGVLVAADPRRAQLSRSATAEIAGAAGLVTITESAVAPLEAVVALADRGARLVLVPVWPEGLDPAALDKLAEERGLRVLSGATETGERIVSLRPEPEVEGRIAGAWIASLGGSSVALFVSDDPDDRMFARAVATELQKSGIQATWLPAELCGARVTVPGLDVAVLATRSASAEECLLSARDNKEIELLGRADSLEGLTDTVRPVAFVSPLDLREHPVTAHDEARVVARWAASLATEAAQAGVDPADGLVTVARPAAGVAPDVDLSRRWAVSSGTVIGAPKANPGTQASEPEAALP